MSALEKEVEDILTEAGVTSDERTFRHEYLAELVREARYDAELSWNDRNQMADALRKLRDKMNGDVKIYKHPPLRAPKQPDLTKDFNKAFEELETH